MLFLIILCIIAIKCEQQNCYVFSINQISLAKCIEEHLLKIDDPYYKENGVANVLAVAIANRFAGKMMVNQVFEIKTNSLYYDISKKRLHSLKDHFVHPPLQFAMKKVLRYCANDVYKLPYVPISENELSMIESQKNRNLDDLDLPLIPIFESEPRDLANLLDYILVDWTLPLHTMIRSGSGRTTLRNYIKNVQMILNCSLNLIIDRNHIRNLVLRNWMHRAQLYFDVNAPVHYIIYRYNIERGVFTYFDIKKFSNRISLNLNDRNPLVPRSNVDNFLRIHEFDRPPFVEDDFFSNYEQNGMTSAEYYFQTHLDQFYQILLCFQELHKNGIITDLDDIYPDSIPFRLLQKYYQEMLYNDVIYHKIIQRVRLHLSFIKRQNYQSSIERAIKTFLECRENSSLRYIINHNTSSTTSEKSHSSQLSSNIEYEFEIDYDNLLNCLDEHCYKNNSNYSIKTHDQVSSF